MTKKTAICVTAAAVLLCCGAAGESVAGRDGKLRGGLGMAYL